LEPKLTRVLIDVSQEAKAAGVTVKRDGKDLPESMWGVAVPIDPGEHSMEASAPGKVARTAKFTAQGEGATIQVSVPPLGDAAPEVPAPMPPEPTTLAPAAAVVASAEAPSHAQPADASPQSAATGGTERVLAYVAGGLGVAGLVTGGLIMQKGNSQNEDAKKICASAENDCPDADIVEHTNLTDSAKNNFNRSYIAFGVGGALLATGVVLLLTAPSESDTGTTTGLNVRLGFSGAGLEWMGCF
jgi:hypothetical protein